MERRGLPLLPEPCVHLEAKLCHPRPSLLLSGPARLTSHPPGPGVLFSSEGIASLLATAACPSATIRSPVFYSCASATSTESTDECLNHGKRATVLRDSHP